MAKTPSRTPVPRKWPSLHYERRQTPQQVAEQLGLNERTIRRWCNRPHAEYTCPHDRLDDGRILLNVDEVGNFMERSGLDGTPGRPDAELIGDECRFWMGIACDYPVAGEKELTTDFERDLLAGVRTLSPDELREYIKTNIRLRTAIAKDLQECARVFLGIDSEWEMQCRLRAILYEPIGFAVWKINLMHDAQDGADRDGDTGILVADSGGGTGVSKAVRVKGPPDSRPQ